MAKKGSNTAVTRTHLSKSKRKNPGVHAKSKTSSNKGSKNYAKPYSGQGR